MTGDPQSDARALAAERPRAILTFAESELRTTADLATRLGLPFHSRTTAAALTDKAEQRSLLRRAGLDEARRPPGVRRGRMVRGAGGPGAARGRQTGPGTGQCGGAHRDGPRGGGAAGGGAVSRRSAWLGRRGVPGGRPSLPYGDYVSVETATTAAGTVPLAVTGKHPLVHPFRETGQFWPVALPEGERRAVCELAVAAVTALGVTTGICHTEIKLTPAGPR